MCFKNLKFPTRHVILDVSIGRTVSASIVQLSRGILKLFWIQGSENRMSILLSPFHKKFREKNTFTKNFSKALNKEVNNWFFINVSLKN